MDGHAALLAALLPSSYAPTGRIVGELAAEGLTLDAALAASLDPLRGLTPLAALEWLEDYERVYDLPGDCRQPGLLLQERLALLAIALPERAGINRAYFIWLAGQLGYAITIEEFDQFKAGFARAGDRITNYETLFSAGWSAGQSLSQGAPWQYVWMVHASGEPTTLFRAGMSGAGEPLASWSNQLLECAIRNAAPAHTMVHFAYGG
ncbi:Prophage tail protein [Desulfovibrio sp. DV]|uniref:putative phage tail protein n=1 Tax=Desulfovibrio sp. DV TaxID=1844708 RepID=UPI00094BA2DF|nr:putative phage tail protein [Desulfovibrio sp. DV]OLN24850.1 Prophage tail protein [Desulfovibrio sp. DV]